MKFKLLKFIKDELNKEKKRTEEEKFNLKESIIDRVTTMWSYEELEQFNIDLLINSAGWLGPYDEAGAKRAIVRENYDLFTEDEIEDLYSIIENQRYVKTFKFTK